MGVVKVLLSLGIVGITTYLGISKASSFKKREEMLKEALTFFNLVENEIKYMMSILPNAYEVARQKLNTELKDAIGEIVVDMLENDNYEASYMSIANNIGGIKDLTEYDKNIIISTLKNLGRSNIDAQMNILENAKQVINVQLDDAIKYKEKNSKLYKTVGTVVGIMTVIVLI